MAESLEALAKMEYPGRFIIVGMDPENQIVVAYGITGRGEDSQARMLVPIENKGVVKVRSTKPQQPAENAALLFYPAMVFRPDGIIVGNGAQVNVVHTALEAKEYGNHHNPAGVLGDAFAKPSLVFDDNLGWVDLSTYEPDKSRTPRITAWIPPYGFGMDSVWHLRDNIGFRQPRAFSFEQGMGRLLLTYTGENPGEGALVPSFRDEPLEIRLEWATPQETAQAIYAALAPKEGGKDLRVAVAVAQYPACRDPATLTEGGGLRIINRSELPKQDLPNNSGGGGLL